MRSKHSYLRLSISPRRTKGGYLQVEGDVEGREKAKIVVVKPMERRRRSIIFKSMVKCYNCQKLEYFANECELSKRNKCK